MTNFLTPEVLFGANTESPCVRQVVGVSGSGKTIFLNQMLRQSAKSKDFSKLWRAIIFDVKHEGYGDLVGKTFQDGESALKNMDEMKITVVHPEISDAQYHLDVIIDGMFNLARTVENYAGVLVLEESSTFIRTSLGGIPDSIKRFATQGRSLGLSLILVNQRSLSNRWTDTQSTSVTCFRLAIPDRKLLKDRWGICAETLDNKLMEKKFSFAHYDLEDLSLQYYDPLILPEGKRGPVDGSQKKKEKRFKHPSTPFKWLPV